MKEKIKEEVDNFKKLSTSDKIKKICIFAFILVLPIIVELLINNYKINSNSKVRLIFMYALYGAYVVYKILNIYTDKLKKFFDFIIKYRYLIGIIAFIVMVIFKINISNIGSWKNFIDAGTNFARGKIIRSDEYEVQTPFFFAQALSDEYYPLNNENIGNGQNMLMVYPAPVANITIIGKPQNIGFLLFGIDYGYSWYWSMKVIALILISIEICLILTKRDSFLSVIFGFIIAYSPAIEWWMSSTGDIYIQGFCIIVLFHYFVNNTDWKLWKKILIAIGMVSSITGFVFCFYPPIQVPMAYIILAFIVIDYIKNFKNIRKMDYIIIITTLLVSFIIIGYYIYVSYDAIKLMMNTSYPGKRNLTGGDTKIKSIMNYFYNLFTPYYDEINGARYTANIYPIIALIIGIMYGLKNFKNKIKDKENWIFYALILLYALFGIWVFVGYGKILSKVTLFYLCSQIRVQLVMELIALMLCLLVLQRKEISLDKFQSVVISTLVVIISYVMVVSCTNSSYFDITKKLILFVVIFLMTYNLLNTNKKGFSYILFLITVCCGLVINPVNVGTDVIFGTNTSKEIRSIVKNSDEKPIWIGNSDFDAQYLIANGAKVLNGVNYYPNKMMLSILDPDGKYEDIYNRYAHISVELTNENDVKFILTNPDAYTIMLDKDDFDALNIKYYYTSEQLDESIMELYNLELIYNGEGKFIYTKGD